MSSAAGGYGAAGSSAEQHQHMLELHHGQHGPGGSAAGQLYHVPQHSRREKLRFPVESMDSPPPPLPTAWPPPAFYSYASSSSSYSPHSPTLAQAQLAAHGLATPLANQNFSLSLSSAASNPPPPRRQLGVGGGGPGTGPYGPFTGYAAVLGRSRFLGPAQRLLEEICDVGARPVPADRGSEESLLDDDPMDAVDHEMEGHRGDRATADVGPVSGAEQQWKKTRLISMMEEVCKRYKQYYQQVQAVISSFETVAGLSNAAPFASLALRAMAKHFKCLKGMILNQLRNASKGAVKEGLSKEDVASFGLAGGSACFQRGSNVHVFSQPHNIWRPQRGLPERAVSVLRAWLFEHFLHPYPTDSDKQMLAKQTGLTRNQVSNWFINARVRLWKPMVEEIHNLEMRQLQKHPALDKNQRGVPQAQHSSACSGKPSAGPSDSLPGQCSSITRNRNITANQNFQDELSQMSHDVPGPANYAYSGLSAQHSITTSHHQQVGGAGLGIGGAGNGGVSLTLGLHQNNRVCIAEPLPAALPLTLLTVSGWRMSVMPMSWVRSEARIGILLGRLVAISCSMILLGDVGFIGSADDA